VFAEVMRILADVDGLLQHLRLEDNTFPPEKRADLTPADSLRQAFELMAEIHRLQREVGIPRTDFEAFRKTEEVVPADVFNMVGLALAELQTIKAQRDLRYSMTPPANYYRDKTPADVHQLLSWVTRKLQLIKRL
jgi:hypothetical protein